MATVNRGAATYTTLGPSMAVTSGVGRVLGDDHTKGANVAKSDSAVGGDWHPTVVNLAVLILLELVAYAGLRYVFRKAL